MAHPNSWWKVLSLITVLGSVPACALFYHENASEDGGGQDAGGPWDEETCYADTTVGCSEISWTDVEQAIEILYAIEPDYAGYTESEALELAHAVYDNGVYPQAYLKILAVEALGGGRYRAYVVVTGTDGYPLPDLSPTDLDLSLEDAGVVSIEPLATLREADTASLAIDLSVVVDDSGSILDCDANFVAQGLAYLFETLPPVYTAELLKFESVVHLAQPRTSDGESLKTAMLTYCTQRESTALWDATYRGLADLPADSPLKAVVLFTDGLDNASSRNYADVVARAQADRTPILALGLGLADLFTLTQLARDTGGGFLYINSGERILDGFKTLTGFILGTYIVEWTADAPFSGLDLSVRVSATETVSDHFDLP